MEEGKTISLEKSGKAERRANEETGIEGSWSLDEILMSRKTCRDSEFQDRIDNWRARTKEKAMMLPGK